jgi:hypothetical protein
MTLTVHANGQSNTTMFITVGACFIKKSTTIRVVIQPLKKKQVREKGHTLSEWSFRQRLGYH